MIRFREQELKEKGQPRMTRTLTTAPGDSDRANIRVFLIALVVMATALWLADHSGATSAQGHGAGPEALTLKTTNH